MKDILRIVEAFYECGVSKETTREIMLDFLENCDVYDEDDIDAMLQSKLSIDSYISIKQYLFL